MVARDCRAVTGASVGVEPRVRVIHCPTGEPDNEARARWSAAIWSWAALTVGSRYATRTRRNPSPSTFARIGTASPERLALIVTCLSAQLGTGDIAQSDEPWVTTELS